MTKIIEFSEIEDEGGGEVDGGGRVGVRVVDGGGGVGDSGEGDGVGGGGVDEE